MKIKAVKAYVITLFDAAVLHDTDVVAREVMTLISSDRVNDSLAAVEHDEGNSIYYRMFSGAGMTHVHTLTSSDGGKIYMMANSEKAFGYDQMKVISAHKSILIQEDYIPYDFAKEIFKGVNLDAFDINVADVLSSSVKISRNIAAEGKRLGMKGASNLDKTLDAAEAVAKFVSEMGDGSRTPGSVDEFIAQRLRSHASSETEAKVITDHEGSTFTNVTATDFPQPGGRNLRVLHVASPTWNKENSSWDFNKAAIVNSVASDEKKTAVEFTFGDDLKVKVTDASEISPAGDFIVPSSVYTELTGQEPAKAMTLEEAREHAGKRGFMVMS